MLPAEIGHAAAYEAFRTWIHNSSIYEPLSGDISRQREGLIGLAVAEGKFIHSSQRRVTYVIAATRLLPYAGRHMDNYARRAASEAAAETASVLFLQVSYETIHCLSTSLLTSCRTERAWVVWVWVAWMKSSDLVLDLATVEAALMETLTPTTTPSRTLAVALDLATAAHTHDTAPNLLSSKQEVILLLWRVLSLVGGMPALCPLASQQVTAASPRHMDRMVRGAIWPCPSMGHLTLHLLEVWV